MKTPTDCLLTLVLILALFGLTAALILMVLGARLVDILGLPSYS